MTDIRDVVIFIGVPRSGKSAFYKFKYFDTHVRVALDMLGSRPREMRLLKACIELKISIVVDNCNIDKTARKRYFDAAAGSGYMFTAVYFSCPIGDCLNRNLRRPKEKQVPQQAIRKFYKDLERPEKDEGFHDIYIVEIDKESGFVIMDE